MRQLLRRLEEATDAPITVDYVAGILKQLDHGNAPDAVRVLQALERSLRFETLEAFPVSELLQYLQSRGVSEDEVAMVRDLRMRAPRAKVTKTVSFMDATMQFERETGKSLIRDMKFVDDPIAGQAVLDWMGGVKRLKPLAKRMWEKAVRKVYFGNARGTEEASWDTGMVLRLTVNRTMSPAERSSMLTHELGHAVEELYGLHGVKPPPWGQPPFCSAYAEWKPDIEDVAESFRVYVEEPALLKRQCPLKYAAVKELLK